MNTQTFIFGSLLAIYSSILMAANHNGPTRDEKIQKIVNRCLESVENGHGVLRYTNRESSDYIFKDNDEIHIKIKIQLRYQLSFTDEEFTQAKILIEEAKNFIREFYAQHHLNVEIKLEHAKFYRNSMNPYPRPTDNAHIVYIRKEMGDAMSVLTWGVNFQWDPIMRGQIYAHEFSHLLGLQDEYDTPRATRIGEIDNIMRNWDAPKPKLYPHQIKQIISPLCPRIL